MQAMPAFLWNKRGVLLSHRGSLILTYFWSSVVPAFAAASASTTNFHPRPFALSAHTPCNILHRRAHRGNRDSGRIAPWRRLTRSEGAFHARCANRFQNVCAASKRGGGAVLDE